MYDSKELHVRILAVDDDSQKLRKLIEIFEESGITREEVDTARSADGARVLLRQRQYDLMVLDLLLPYRDEDEGQVQTSIDLLDEVSERDAYKKPVRVIGFTAHEDAESVAAPHFANRIWTIVRYDVTTNEWQEQFRRALKYILASAASGHTSTYGLDLCVVTALRDPEHSAVNKLPWKWEAAEPVDDATFVRRGRITGRDRDYTVVSACAPRMGNVAAALITSRVITTFRPRFIVMAGICAGIRRKVNPGDVVLFSPRWEWASGKVVPDKDLGSYLQPAPHQIPIADFILARAEELKADSRFWLEVHEGFPDKPEVLPKLVIGPGASGPSVIASSDYAESIKAQHRTITAIDMESYGVAAAADAAVAPKPVAFSMKSVCDFADEEKDDAFQQYAAYTSATTIRRFFERYIDELARIIDN